MTCGIYAIVCDKTWRSYVGQTKNFETRFLDHLQGMKRGDHFNIELQSDFDLYGESSFFYELIEKIEDEKLLGIRESYWINYSDNLYNKTNPSNQLILSKEEQERFWKWVNVGAIEECWEWFGAKDKDGYGRIGYKRNGKKIMHRSNRLAHFLTHPEDDINLVVRHTCHNPKCCNPNHLLIGTNSDNKRDLLNKENNHYTLNWNIVKEVRNKFIENPNIIPSELDNWFEDKYNLKMANCHLINICLNKSWIDEKYNPPERTLKYYVTEEDIQQIKMLLESGLTSTQCYKELTKNNTKISKTSYYRIIKKIKEK